MNDIKELTITNNTPPIIGGIGQKIRSSNFELYRIFCMLMIVAHHYLVNSGLAIEGGPIASNPTALKSIYLTFFGGWGKVGINCFLMITGYFMCTSSISFKKFLKLMAQIYFYKLLLFPIFFLTGYETFSLERIIKLIMPVWGFSRNFTSCFIVFWLTIPFLNTLIRGLNKRQHELLILFCLCCYSLLGSIPKFQVDFNYITWFGIIYFVASYVRLYPQPIFQKKGLWGWLTLAVLFLSIASIFFMQWHYAARGEVGYFLFFLDDSNRILAVAFAFCSFIWFKNLDIKYNKMINAFGAGAFGVLLIHANSDAMRTWLWEDVVNCVSHYTLSFAYLILYSVGVVLAIFIVCNLIDQLRIATLEKWFLKWYDNRCATKVESIINTLINGK